MSFLPSEDLLTEYRFQSLRYVKPPESLITQLDIYTEEKFEDEEDLRERNLTGHRREVSDSEIVLDGLIRSAKQYHELYPTVVGAVSHLRTLVENPNEMYVSLKTSIISS